MCHYKSVIKAHSTLHAIGNNMYDWYGWTYLIKLDKNIFVYIADWYLEWNCDLVLEYINGYDMSFNCLLSQNLIKKLINYNSNLLSLTIFDNVSSTILVAYHVLLQVQSSLLDLPW